MFQILTIFLEQTCYQAVQFTTHYITNQQLSQSQYNIIYIYYIHQSMNKQTVSSQSVSQVKYRIKNWIHIFQADNQNHLPFISDIQILPAVDQSHIVVYDKSMMMCLVHFDKNGNILGRIQVDPEQFVQVKMISSTIAAILRVEKMQSGTLKFLIDFWILNNPVKTQQSTKSKLGSKFDYDYESMWQKDNYQSQNKAMKNTKSKQNQKQIQKSKVITIDEFNYHFQTKITIRQQLDFIVFTESQTFCLCQYQFRGMYEPYLSTKIWIHHYKFDSFCNKLQMINKSTYKVEPKNIERQLRVRKINNNYTVAILPHAQPYFQQTSYIYIYIMDWHKEQIQFCNQLRQNIPNFCDVLITDFWEIYPKIIYVKLQSRINIKRYQQAGSPAIQNIQQLYKQQQWIWNKIQDTLRKPTYCSNIKANHYQVQFVQNLRDIQKFTLQIPITTKNLQNKKVLELPLYLVSCFNQHQFVQQQFKLQGIQNSNQQKYPVTLQNKICLYKFQSQALEIKEISYNPRKYSRDIALCYIMLSVMPEFDDDLLRQVLQLCQIYKQGELNYENESF